MLVEDQDDDNDGTPDSLENGVSSQDESSSGPSLILGVGVVVILAGIVLSRMRKED